MEREFSNRSWVLSHHLETKYVEELQKTTKTLMVHKSSFFHTITFSAAHIGSTILKAVLKLDLRNSKIFFGFQHRRTFIGLVQPVYCRDEGLILQAGLFVPRTKLYHRQTSFGVQVTQRSDGSLRETQGEISRNLYRSEVVFRPGMELFEDKGCKYTLRNFSCTHSHDEFYFTFSTLDKKASERYPQFRHNQTPVFSSYESRITDQQWQQHNV